jgi:hypothetical protein
LSGGADAFLILDSNSNGQTIYGRGRDLEEFDKAIRFNRHTCRWEILGDAADVKRSDERSKIIDVSTAEQKCARWLRESVPVRLREKGCEAPAICLSARIETRGVIQSLGLASPSRVVFGVAFVA